MTTQALARLTEFPIVPVVTIETTEHLGMLKRAFRDHGITTVEVLLRTDAALDGLAELADSDLTVGAGTVLTLAQADAALAAGAEFIVSPGLDLEVAEYVASRGVTMIPGIATPTEAQQALTRGMTHLKVFPARVLGGVSWVRALAASLPSARFMPSGGIDEALASDMLAEPSVFAVGCSWLTPTQALTDGDEHTLHAALTRAVDIVSAVSR